MTMSEGDLAVAQIRFVRMQQIDSLPAPLATTGAIGWLRANLLSTPFNMVMTFLVALLLIWIVPDTLRFLIFDAVWSGEDRVACLADARPGSRRLLAVRMGAAAVFHLRLLSDPAALARRHILRDAGGRRRVDVVAQRAAA